MNWVIICASYWLVFDTQNGAQEHINNWPTVAEKSQCAAPKEAPALDIEFYKSVYFVPMQIESLAEIELNEPDQESKYVPYYPSLGPQKEKEEPEPEPSASPSSEGKHCVYAFVRTGPKSLRMISECEK